MDRKNLSLRQLQTVLQDRRSKNTRRSTPRDRPGRRRDDTALALGEAIRGRIYRAGPTYKSHNPAGGDKQNLGDVNTYYLVINGKKVWWDPIERAIRRELAGPDGWMLKDYLWSDKPTRTHFVVAREVLTRIWEESVMNRAFDIS